MRRERRVFPVRWHAPFGWRVRLAYAALKTRRGEEHIDWAGCEACGQGHVHYVRVRLAYAALKTRSGEERIDWAGCEACGQGHVH